MYISSRSMMQCQTKLEVLAGLCLGPVSAIIVNLLIVCAIYGICTLYMLLFSDICLSLIGSYERAENGKETAIYDTKYFYIVILSLLMTPFVVKKSIAELRFNSYILFFGIFALTTVLAVRLIVDGSYQSLIDSGAVIQPPPVPEDDSISYFEKIIDSLNIAVAS
jgi:amino acid permease